MRNLNLNLEKGEQGVSIYIAFMIMAILMVIAFGMSSILFGQMKVIKGMGDSVIAFFAADTGIEKALYEGWEPPTSYTGPTLGNGSYYIVDVIAPNSDCSAPNYCINSRGFFNETRRAIQAIR